MQGFSPSVKSLEGIDVEKIPSLQEQPVQSAITFPMTGANVSIPLQELQEAIADGNKSEKSIVAIPVRGYAYSGGGRGIVRVDVSGDGGKSWQVSTVGCDVT